MNNTQINSIATKYNSTSTNRLEYSELRYWYVSMIRFIAMGLIIMCHICQFYDSMLAWWFNIGVQIFFVLSGFLYGNKKIEDPILWVKRNYIKILLPYYIFSFVAIILHYLFASESINIVSVIKLLFCVGTIDRIGHLWFVGHILFCYLITPYLAMFTEYLSNRKQDIKREIITILLLFACFYILCISIKFYFQVDKILCYLVGYFVAYFVTNYGDKVYKLIFILSTPLAILSKIIYVKLNMQGYCHISHVEGFSHMLLGVALTFGMIFIFREIKFNYRNLFGRILNFSDKNSYCIYLCHQLFILSPFTLMLYTEYRIVNILITLIMIVITGTILQIVATRISRLLNL